MLKILKQADGLRAGREFLWGSRGRGSGKSGVAFKITSSGKFTVLHAFDQSKDASHMRLVQGSDGNFDGTTLLGGTTFGEGVLKIRGGDFRI